MVCGNLYIVAGSTDPQIEVNYLDNGVEVLVSDNGIGIPKNEIEKVFNSFYRATNTLTYQGSGLGLVVAKQFLELHNGSIHLHSDLGKGTQVFLKIPYSK